MILNSTSGHLPMLWTSAESVHSGKVVINREWRLGGSARVARRRRTRLTECLAPRLRPTGRRFDKGTSVKRRCPQRPPRMYRQATGRLYSCRSVLDGLRRAVRTACAPAASSATPSTAAPASTNGAGPSPTRTANPLSQWRIAR